MVLKRKLASALIATGLAVSPMAVSVAMAQDAQPGMEETQPGMDATTIVEQDGKLDAFIMAALSVSEARQGYIAQLETAATEEEQLAIVEEADAAILETVESTPGITVEEYILIGEAAAADPELAARIDARFMETQGTE